MTAPGQNPYPGGPNPGYGPGPGYGYPPPTGPNAATGPGPGSEPSGSKALPVIVATGLAVGVFSGLLLVRGTGEAKGTEGTTPPAVVDAGVAVVPDKPGTKADAGPQVATADAGAAPAPDAAPEKVPEVAEPKIAKLTFQVTPDDTDVEISVEDQKLDGLTYDLELGDEAKKAVKIVARADGYRLFVKRLVVRGDETVEIALRKRSSSTGGGSSQPRPSRPKGPGGLIDL